MGDTIPRPVLVPDRELARILAPLQRPNLSEWEWWQVVRELAKAYGWEWLKVPSATVRPGEHVTQVRPGWPDVILLKPPRLVFLELKRDRNSRVTPDQVRIVAALQEVTEVEAYFARPRDARELVSILAGQ